MEMFGAELRCFVLATFYKNCLLTTPIFGVNDRYFEMIRLVSDFNLLPFFRFDETIFHRSVNIKVLNVSSVFGFPQRDENIPPITLLISIYLYARPDVVLYKNVTITPCIIFKCNDMVLKKLDPLVFFENRRLSFAIQKFQGDVIFENFVQPHLFSWQ